MGRYKFSWDKMNVIIVNPKGKRVKFPCLEKWKGIFFRQLVRDANQGLEARDEAQEVETVHSPDVDDANNFTE